MGYDITIGEAEIDWSGEHVNISCKTVELPDAPAFDEPTDRTNSRWPSYTSWGNFCRELKIVDVMFCSDNCDQAAGWFEVDGTTRFPLMSEHPGVAPITTDHLIYIEAAVARYMSTFPDHIAQYPPVKEGIEDKGLMNSPDDLVDDPKYDGNLVRAE